MDVYSTSHELSVMKYFLSAYLKSECSTSEICWSKRSENSWPEFTHGTGRQGAVLHSPMILLPKFFNPFLEEPSKIKYYSSVCVVKLGLGLSAEIPRYRGPINTDGFCIMWTPATRN